MSDEQNMPASRQYITSTASAYTHMHTNYLLLM